MTNKFKILHVVSGTTQNGAFKGALILHKALLNLKIESSILNDCYDCKKKSKNNFQIKNINNLKKNTISKIIGFFYIFIEKFLKSLFLKNKRSSFTIGLLGFDISKTEEYKKADIVHIHWIDQGFIKISSLKNIKKPIIWTMRDMWAFSGGAHYTMDFKNYEDGKFSKIIKNYKKKIFGNNICFIAISEWLKDQANKSITLKESKIKKIYNNIEFNKFKIISKETAKLNLHINTKKKILLFGAVNPQHKRKGWNIFIEALTKLDKSKYFLVIFGNFWSYQTLDKIGIEYKSFGFVNNFGKLNNIFSCADLLIFPSIQEAFGKIWVEAMACGTPVVCFNKTPPAEIINHKQNGFIVNNFESNSLIKGIEWMSNQFTVDEKIRVKIREKASKFDSHLIALEYKKLYEDILKKKNIIIDFDHK
tara:strand:+ start:1561 stop:2820 length:1260 start_codon:yes stop_codon:yes gene_type:complete